MKEHVVGTARFLVVGGLLAAVSLLLLLRVGRRRGTWAYRLRMRLWTAALGLAGGAVLCASLLGLHSCKGGDGQPAASADASAGQSAAAVASTPDARPQPAAAPSAAAVAPTPDARPQPAAAPSAARTVVVGEIGPPPSPEPVAQMCYDMPSRRSHSELEPAKQGSTGGELPQPARAADVAVTVGPVESFKGGQIDQNALAGFLGRRAGAFRSCYLECAGEAAKAGGPSSCTDPVAAGASMATRKVVLRVKVQPSGRAEAEVQSDQLNCPGLAQCLASRADQWRLPPPKDKAAEFSVTIAFGPGS